MNLRLDRVYTMPELAAMIGWPRRKLVRHLLRMNREAGGLLLKNSGTIACPRWTTTLDALRGAAPQWFRDSETLEARLDAIEDAQTRDSAVIEVQTKRIAALAAEVRHLRTVTDLLGKNLRAVVQQVA